jgi:hypothetical protein
MPKRTIILLYSNAYVVIFIIFFLIGMESVGQWGLGYFGSVLYSKVQGAWSKIESYSVSDG